MLIYNLAHYCKPRSGQQGQQSLLGGTCRHVERCGLLPRWSLSIFL